MAQEVDKLTKLFRQIWEKAYTQGELRLPFRDLAELERTRIKLYNSVKRIRSGAEGAMPDLLAAVNNVTIKMDKEKLELLLIRFDADESVQRLAEAAGIDIGGVKTKSESVTKEMHDDSWRLVGVSAEVEKGRA